MLVVLETVFTTMFVVGMLTLTVGLRRYNISQRALTIAFALTTVSWMGFLVTTIALFVRTQIAYL